MECLLVETQEKNICILEYCKEVAQLTNRHCNKHTLQTLRRLFFFISLQPKLVWKATVSKQRARFTNTSYTSQQTFRTKELSRDSRSHHPEKKKKKWRRRRVPTAAPDACLVPKARMEGGWVTGTTKQPRLATVTPIKKKAPRIPPYQTPSQS